MCAGFDGRDPTSFCAHSACLCLLLQFLLILVVRVVVSNRIIEISIIMELQSVAIALMELYRTENPPN